MNDTDQIEPGEYAEWAFECAQRDLAGDMIDERADKPPNLT